MGIRCDARPGLVVVFCLFCLLGGTAAAGSGWPVSEAEPQKITLSRYQSLTSLMRQWLFGPDDWQMTIAELSQDRPDNGNHDEQLSTGNTITLALPPEVVNQNISSGPGIKPEVSVTLYYSNGSIFTSFEPGAARISLSMYSTNANVNKRQRNHQKPGWPPPEVVTRIIDSRASSDEAAVGRYGGDQLLYDGDRRCGFHVVEYLDGSAALTGAPRALSLNLYVKRGDANGPAQILRCNSGVMSTDGKCISTMPFGHWAAVTYSLPFDRICDADAIREGIDEWLKSKVVLETVERGNQH